MLIILMNTMFIKMKVSRNVLTIGEHKHKDFGQHKLNTLFYVTLAFLEK